MCVCVCVCVCSECVNVYTVNEGVSSDTAFVNVLPLHVNGLSSLFSDLSIYQYVCCNVTVTTNRFAPIG